jgi:hypothetical protein
MLYSNYFVESLSADPYAPAIVLQAVQKKRTFAGMYARVGRCYLIVEMVASNTISDHRSCFGVIGCFHLFRWSGHGLLARQGVAFDPEVACFRFIGGDLTLIGLSRFQLSVHRLYEVQYSALRGLHLPFDLFARL